MDIQRQQWTGTNGELRVSHSLMPLRHRRLSDEMLKLCKFTYDKLGKLQCSTLEQWETGFMRDTNPHNEMDWWLRACMVADKLPKMKPRRLLARLSGASVGLEKAPRHIQKAWGSITDDQVREMKRKIIGLAK